MSDTKTATFVRKLENFTGEAALYKVDPPIEQKNWDDEVEATHDFVAVSATAVPFSGAETYIFPADEEGNVLDWGELDGSYRGGLSHTTALSNAGYTSLFL